MSFEVDKTRKLFLSAVMIIGFHPLAGVNDVYILEKDLYIGSPREDTSNTIYDAIQGIDNELTRDYYIQAQIPTASSSTASGL